jgi:hypothetical protein
MRNTKGLENAGNAQENGKRLESRTFDRPGHRPTDLERLLLSLVVQVVVVVAAAPVVVVIRLLTSILLQYTACLQLLVYLFQRHD